MTNDKAVADWYDELIEEFLALDISDRAVEVITAIASLDTLALIDLDRFGYD